MAFIEAAKEPGGVLTLPAETPLVIVGDFNLVGDPQQLETLITGAIINDRLFGKGAAPDWDGTTGFIHTVLDRELITGIHGEAYLCGPPIMIDAVMAVLESKGIPKESILYDKF